MDPKRFTPTLHASLVSEILALRRELDAKHNFIDGLEDNLDRVKAQNEGLADQLAKTTKDSKVAEQRFQRLESGTLDAVEDLARERDTTQTLNAELKAKLEALSRRTRKQEEEAVHSQESWEKEKQSWENERRQLERRVHVTENRLRMIVEEMSLQQAMTENRHHDPASEPDTGTFKDSGIDNNSDGDNASLRSYRTFKHTRMRSSISARSTPCAFGSPAEGAAPSTNLADELGLEEEDEYDINDLDHNDDDLLADERLGRSSSTRSSMQSEVKAKKILGLAGLQSDLQSETAPRQTAIAVHGCAEPTISEPAAQLGIDAPNVTPNHVDSGVQPSRPESPVISQTKSVEDSSVPEWSFEIDGQERRNSTADSEQSWTFDLSKEGLPSIFPDYHPNSAPLSPPETPVAQATNWNEADGCTTSTSARPMYEPQQTQTASTLARPEVGAASPRRSISVDTLPIPSIAIHPPLSASAATALPMIPPGMANSAAQTDPSLCKTSCDAAVQTEEIRIDTRSAKLPPHLWPSTVDVPRSRFSRGEIPANPLVHKPSGPSAAPSQMRRYSANDLYMPLKPSALPSPTLSTTREEERQKEKPSMSVINEDTSESQPPLGHSPNTNSMLDYGDGYSSDVDPRDISASASGLAKHMSKVFQGPPKTVPEDKEISPAHGPVLGSAWEPFVDHLRRDSESSSGTRPRSSIPGPGSSFSSRGRIRLRSHNSSISSMGSSGQSSITQQPPFPIPTRGSSRSRSMAASDGASSPTPPEFRDRQANLRKVQSSNTMRQRVPTSPKRRGRPVQLTPIQSMAFDDGSPTLNLAIPDVMVANQTPFSPLIDNEFARPDTTVNANEEETQDNDLVDAIAATMVGEWMWKYVRRRKSFGVGEATPGDDGMNGVRHKRWVWLSPYERTVMWSSKQPTTGSALLGKNGRKCESIKRNVSRTRTDISITVVINSVLDVKDDGPLPKGAAPENVFDRSILILTPERALKFTTSTMERHYLWLTALSFLAQSGRGPPQVPRIPPNLEATPTKKRRPSLGIRNAARKDSVRHAKPVKHRVSITAPPMPLIPGQSIEEERELIPPPTAEGPVIPRSSFQRHRRQRSNTNPGLPPTVFAGMRSLTSPLNSLTGSVAPSGPPFPSPYKQSFSSEFNGTVLESSPEGSNFFEAMGTVRMEAFVDPTYNDGILYVPAAPSTSHALKNGLGRGNSIVSATTNDTSYGNSLDYGGSDPFGGF